MAKSTGSTKTPAATASIRGGRNRAKQGALAAEAVERRPRTKPKTRNAAIAPKTARLRRRQKTYARRWVTAKARVWFTFASTTPAAAGFQRHLTPGMRVNGKLARPARWISFGSQPA